MKVIAKSKGYYEIVKGSNKFLICKSESSKEWEFSVDEGNGYERLENCKTLKEAKEAIANKWQS